MNQQFPRVPYEASRGPLRFTPGSAEPQGQVVPVGLPPSLTYEPYYGLKEKAFSLSADPRFLYRSPTHAPAFEELLTGIRRREGLIVLTGEVGTGKTTLIRSVLQNLDRRTFTAFVPDPFVSREDLLKMLLVDFGVVSVADLKQGSLAGASRPDLSYPLYEFLDSLVPLQAFAVLIIDEAQNLPLPLLEEIRILSDLEQREKLLQVVLVGQPELRSHLKLPELRQVNQRVSVRCELAALGADNIGEYVRHRLLVAGGGECRVEFSAAALESIFQASGGVPRVINLLCDRALQRGQAARARLVDSTLIDEAVAALGLEQPTVPPVVTDKTEARRTTNETAKPAAPVVKPSSVPIQEAQALSPQFLADFAAETEMSRDEGRRIGLWRLAASLILVALTAAAIAGFWYVYFTTATVDVRAATLPPSPVWSTPAKTDIPAPPPLDTAAAPATGAPAGRPPAASVPQGSGLYSIQVASFESQSRADRLVSELTGAGFRARIVAFDMGPSHPLLQVRVEGYDTITDATRDLVRIRELPGYGDARIVAN